MKIAVAQINTTIGDFEGNAAKIISYIGRAEKEGVDLVVFPEMSVTSYPPKDLLEKAHFIKKNLAAIEAIARKCTNIAAIVGFVSVNEQATGKGIFNSAAFLANGKIEFVQNKTLLPTYDVFDEARYFEPAMKHGVHPFKGCKIGITICEDIWSIIPISGRKLYNYDPVDTLVKDGADILINISASPFHVGKAKIRQALLMQNAAKHRRPIIYANMIGGNDELIFDGHSVVVNANGEVIHEGKCFQEDFFVIDTGSLAKEYAPVERSGIEDVHDGLILGLSDYIKKCGFKKAVIGLSGGIDSCIVAALAVEAFGKKNVLGIGMPSPYSSKESITDAEELAKNLGIQFKVVPITKIYSAYLETLGVKKGQVTLTEENVQARIRGNILMAESNKTGALVLSTGNKSELAVGYCTLYGDMAGGLSVISDVPKTLVYQLANYINRSGEVIPKNCITKPPSAELRPDQKDTDSLPAYEVLDEILRLYIEEQESAPAIIDRGFKKKVVADVVARVDRNEYKRRQAAPGLKVTSKAFAAGRIYPIAWKY